ncbi:pyridoxal phosphate-dependent aminotransferase [Bacteriovorax stolpii]|uniref:pyridoxal phosphate-dependent aminotransferase n=1 Tax=Bacteriovorax stolpii TaxID=960 RepID=UPI00115AF5E2|nr:pyridoxal phosphate-dependent aminotransferase [Bacteriovorax stolpii]QDK41620.1 pyridoxal phosphate-dependent aminotransferase [Bacteriovorax stolpii]
MSRLDNISLGKIVVIREKLLKAQKDGQKIYRFESGDPSFDVHPNVKSAIEKALEANKTHYIPNNGIPELRETLAQKLNTQNKIPVKPTHISITNGAMHALYVTYQCIVEEGDEVIVPDPMWTEAVENARLAGAKTIGIELKPEHNYVYRAADIEKAITKKTKVIFLNSPQNPTGAIIPLEELQKIADLAVKNNLWIVSDEAYEHILFDGGTHTSIASLIPTYDKTVSVYSYSKSYAMSGLRLGYFASMNELFNDRAAKLLRCTVNGINSISQWGAIHAVKDTPAQWYADMNAEYLKRRNLFLDSLKDQDILTPYVPKAAFYLWCKVKPGIDVEKLSEELAQKGIGNAPGSCFGDSPESLQSIRLAFSCDTQMIVEGSKELNKFLRDYK